MLKPNLLKKAEVDKAVITHPTVVGMFARLMREKGYQDMALADSCGNGTTSKVIRHEQYVENDEVCELTTRSLKDANFGLTLSGQDCNLILAFNDNNECTLSTDTPGCTVSGSGKYVEKGEKNFKKSPNIHICFPY